MIIGFTGPEGGNKTAAMTWITLMLKGAGARCFAFPGYEAYYPKSHEQAGQKITDTINPEDWAKIPVSEEFDYSMIYYNQPGPWEVGTEEVVIERARQILANPRSEGALSPEQALEAFHLPEGFEIELVAAEPLIEDPVNFEFGPDGRLWVVEMGDYPRGDGDIRRETMHRCSPHSVLSNVIGSTRVARRAGVHVAMAATNKISTATAPYVTGSWAATP